MRPAPAILAGTGLAAIAATIVIVVGLGRAGSDEACRLDKPQQPSAHPATQPLVWNAYDEPVSPARLVHNLVHGGVAVQWGRGVPDASVERVLAWYRSDPDATVLAPRPELGDRIVLTAWSGRASCPTFHERAFSRFRSRYRFDGPESPPRETLRPGRVAPANALGLTVSPSPVRGPATLSFVFRESVNVAVEIHAGRESGPLVRLLGRVSLVPEVRAALRWDGRDDSGRRVPAGAYAAVARGERVTAVAPFEVR